MAAHSSPKRVAIPIELQWNVPWHLDCFQGIADYGNEHGWQCVVDPYLAGATGDGDLSGYEGVVGRISDHNAKRVTSLGLPGVNLLRTQRDHGLHSITLDQITGTRLAAEHLLAHGYRRCGQIGIVTEVKAYLDSVLNIFAQTITSQGLPAPVVIEIERDALCNAESSQACLRTLTNWIMTLDKPIGLYIYNYELARYVAQICSQLGLHIPEDVGIVVQDADSINTTSVTPTLSAIDFDYWDQGYQAAALLDRLMQGESVEPRNKLIKPRRVIVRETTDVFVCGDELVAQAMRYIAEHIKQTLLADDVAATLNVSRRTLDRRFEEVAGKTVSQEIVRLRIEQLEHMLSESELAMSKIADLFGFGSASQFTQFFKKHAGVTPTAYRKQYKSAQ